MSDRSLILSPMSRTWLDAATFAKAVHEGQVDKAGNPYWKHLRRVESLAIDKLPYGSSRAQEDHVSQIAWLHDVLEDTPYTADDLLDEGFSRNVVDAVKALTKPSPHARYHDWIEHIGMTATLPAILVKLADNEDNSDPKRLALLPADQAERLEQKYTKARALLVAAAEKHGWRDVRQQPR